MTEQTDDLWAGGPKFLKSPDGFPLSTDSVLLADFVRDIHARTIIDLGCGAGVLPVLLGISHPVADIFGIELQPASAELCRANLKLNNMRDCGILTGDIREHRKLHKAGNFDLVVSNPPYFASGSGFCAPDDARATARDERFCTPDDLFAAARFLCRWGGAFAFVHRPERLPELLCKLCAAGLEPKKMKFIQYTAGSAPSLVLIETRRGGKPGLSVMPPLLMTDGNGNDSPEICRIYHRTDK